MELIADILLVAGALGAGMYCFVLAQRLKRFNDLEKGVGGAVAVLSAQVDDLTKTLAAARDSSTTSNTALSELTDKAESVAQRLELMMASMHDVPETVPPTPPSAPAVEPEKEIPVEAGIPSPPPKQSGVMFVRHDRSQAGAA
ncbi:hypothetical protein DS909_11330 [Phaeobacter gallaeciensis]|uniref:Uncharacterized protein n=2 Tax=Roseobacteraceae TaxID=2854170 RepID=A0A366X157_9RHOB|nr:MULTISPECIES: hypothetical protein [Roseobacteraceae]MBT3141254.1 hypothetical protein [Falsiruegeria litorea]MBT8170747.1 hypothetical protein [Falsiruegeria litorea]RBW54433.1 hypothetical protein DS909_11330 [Phaeobacter gallaeciensis]